MNDLPTNYAKSPITPPPGSLEKTLQPTMDGIDKNFNLVQQSIVSIIAFLKFLAGAVSDLQSAVSSITKRVIIIEDTLDGIVNAALFNRGPGNTEQLNAKTILDAAASITGLPKTLYLKRGTWIIDADVDLSTMESSLLLAPGAELQQVGSFAFKFPLNVTIPDQGFHFSGDTGFIVPLVGSRLTLNPQWYGALDAADSTAALIAYEQSLFAQETTAVMPAGDYGFDGRWDVRMGIAGFGVNINQLSAVATTALNAATVYAINVDNFFVRGAVKIDGNNTRVGLHYYNCDNAEIAGLTVENCMTAGIYFENSHYCYLHDLNIRHVIFSSLHIVADGVLQVACEYSRYENNYAYDVNRIHFVSEGYVTPGPKSKEPSYFRCTGEYAHDMDSSTTENNGAFWAENTNGANWTECYGINISNAIGQSARFARAFTVGGGQTEYCDFNFTKCRVLGNTSATTAQPLRGFSLSGTGDFARVNFLDCMVDAAYQCLVVQSGIREVNIKNFLVSNWTVNAADSAGVMVVTTTDLLKLTIDGLTELNCTRNVNGGTVLFFGPAVNCVYTLKNAIGITHAMTTSSGDVAASYVSDCEINYGCSSRTSFTGPVAKFARVKATVRAATNARLWRYSGSAAGANCALTDTDLIMGTNLSWGVAVGTADFTMKGGSVTGGFVRIEPTVACKADFTDVKFRDYPAAGAVQGGALSRITVTGGLTYEATGLIVPFQPQPATAGPITSVIVGVHYQNTAVLTTWAVPTVAANQPY